MPAAKRLGALVSVVVVAVFAELDAKRLGYKRSGGSIIAFRISQAVKQSDSIQVPGYQVPGSGIRYRSCG